MSIQVKCPSSNCDQQLMLSPEMAGKKGQCPKCGKTFQIPQKLAQKSAAKPAPGSETPSPQPSAPQTQPGNALSADELADFLVDGGTGDTANLPQAEIVDSRDAEVIDDYEAVDDYDAPRGRRPPRDEYSEYADEDDEIPVARRKSGGGISKTRKWKLLNVGFLIVAISTCVFGGALVLSFAAEMFGEIAVPAKSLALFRISVNFLKIAQVFYFIASLGLVTGYVFCIFTPNKHASLGLMIATLSVGTINMVMRIIFRMVAAFSSDMAPMDRSLFAIAGSAGGAGRGTALLFLEFGAIAEVVLLALFMTSVARMQKDKVQRRDCMRTVWFMTAVAGVVFIECIFLMIQFTDRWPVYIVRTMNWGANGVLGLAMVFHIINLFHSYRSTK